MASLNLITKLKKLPDLQRRLPEILGLLGIAAAVYWGIFHVFPALWSRVNFPMGVEQQEDVHISILYQWLKAGFPLYSTPTLENSGWVYTPGYYLVAAAWTYFNELSLPSLRILSWLCVILTVAPVVSISETFFNRRIFGLLWLPLYLFFAHIFGWIDLAMKDSLHILLSLSGFSTLVHALYKCTGRHRKFALALSALLWSMALLTKQTTLINLAPLAGALAVYSLKDFIFFGAFFSGISGLMLAACTMVWGKAFWTWTLFIPRAHPYDALTSFVVTQEFLGKVYPLLIAAIGISFVYLSQKKQRDYVFVFLSYFLLGCFLSAVIPAGKVGGGIYNFPILSAGLVAFVVVLLPVVWRTQWMGLFVLMPLVIYSPNDRALPPEYFHYFNNTVDELKKLPAKTWVAYHPWLGHLAGKKIYASAESLFGQWERGQVSVPPEFAEAARRKYFDVIVLDSVVDFGMWGDTGLVFLQNYEIFYEVPPQFLIVPRDGWTNRNPAVFWRPKSDVKVEPKKEKKS